MGVLAMPTVALGHTGPLPVEVCNANCPKEMIPIEIFGLGHLPRTPELQEREEKVDPSPPLTGEQGQEAEEEKTEEDVAKSHMESQAIVAASTQEENIGKDHNVNQLVTDVSQKCVRCAQTSIKCSWDSDVCDDCWCKDFCVWSSDSQNCDGRETCKSSEHDARKHANSWCLEKQSLAWKDDNDVVLKVIIRNVDALGSHLKSLCNHNNETPRWKLLLLACSRYCLVKSAHIVFKFRRFFNLFSHWRLLYSLYNKAKRTVCHGRALSCLIVIALVANRQIFFKYGHTFA